jgi:hypothetical protein
MRRLLLAPGLPVLAFLLLLPGLPRAGPIAAAAVPVPSWRTVPIGGGGFVTGAAAHPAAPYHTYIRTDVGGAYRRDASNGSWVPLQEWLPRSQGRYFGVEAIGLHPNRQATGMEEIPGTEPRFPSHSGARSAPEGG